MNNREYYDFLSKLYKGNTSSITILDPKLDMLPSLNHLEYSDYKELINLINGIADEFIKHGRILPVVRVRNCSDSKTCSQSIMNKERKTQKN